MYFDNISNLRKAAQTHFAYRSMGTASGWLDCWGGWGCKETFFFRKNQNMKFFNDIQHKPIENFFSEASLNACRTQSQRQLPKPVLS